MKYRYKHLAWALALALGTAPALAATDAAVLRSLWAGPRLDRAAAERLYREATLEAGGAEALYRELEQVAASAAAPAERARALLAGAELHWQQGDGAQAMAEVDRALALAPGVDAWLLKGRLLDAQGNAATAGPWYRKAAEASDRPAERAALQLRLALLDAHDPAGALRELARKGPQAFANRAAVALALLGRPDDALALYRMQGQGASIYAQHVQAADWAIVAGDHAQAREQAWAAFGVAANVPDRRYALALLMEAYRNQGTLADAITFLASQPAQPEVEQARVDALLELQRYDEAIARVRAASDPQLRQRLLGILELAGRREALVAEYRRLIQAQPHAPEGYDGLAALYMSEDDPAQALAVYRSFFAANRGRADRLIPAARQMAAMGLQAQAVELLGQGAEDAAMAVPVDFFLFDTYMDQGQDAQAAQALERLRRRLPATDPRRVEVADGYERLQRPDQALAVLSEMERQRKDGLDYDLQVRMADLAVKSGQGEVALTRLRRLWEQARLPARRAFLERQIVRVAQSLGRLDQIAAAFDARLAAGTVQRSEVDLLVAIRLVQGNREAAEAAVSRYAASARGGDAVQRLSQLSDFYVRLGDSEQLDRTLRRLIQADPANADLYLRRLAVNTLRQPVRSASGERETPEQQRARVEWLISELQRADGGQDAAAASRFAAGLYAMAGLDQQAIGQYRRVVAQAPGDIDSLLQLADQLRKSQRIAEAAALLQSVAEYATDQKTFLLAVDGLLGLYAGNDDGAQRRGQVRLSEKVLQWAQRRVLERIASSEEPYPLYSLLADLGQVQADFQLQVRAYESALPLAGEQRPLILRQLVTLNSPAKDDGGTGPVVGDDRQKIRFGRRLIALRREFPPDFYADLARSMLAGGDALGAERAFSVMSDIGGLVNLAQVKGEAYAAEGYTEQALLNYGQALARDQDNLDLLLKTSILREQQGQQALANRWYWHALRTLILRQPQQDGGVPPESALDLQRYYPSLVEGLSITWPEEAGDRQRLLAELRQMFAETMAQVDPAQAQPLAHYPRLGLIVALARRIAAFGDDFALTDAFDADLARAFPTDSRQQADTAYYRRLTGRPLPADQEASGEDDWPMRGLRIQARQAGEAGNPGLALAVEISQQDEAGMSALVQAALMAEHEARRVAASGSRTGRGTATLYTLIVQSMDKLPPDMFRRLVFVPLDVAPFRDEVLFNLFRGDPEHYAKLERIVGRPLLDDDVLIRMLVDHGNDPMPYRSKEVKEKGAAGQIERFSVDQQIAFYAALVTRQAQGGHPSMLQSLLLQGLLKQPLNAGQRTRVLEALKTEIDSQPTDGSSGSIIPRLLVLDADAGNRQLLLQAGGYVAEHHPEVKHLPEFLQAYFSGDREKAYALLLALQQDTGDQAGDYAASIVRQFFPEQRQRRIELFLSAEAPDESETIAFYREFVLGALNGSERADRAALIPYYHKLLSLDPGNTTYLAGLLDLQWQRRDTASFLSTLRAYVDHHPDDMDAATVLALGYRVANQPAQAQAVAQASGVDIDDAAWIARMINKANAPRRGGLEPDFGRLFQTVFDAYQAAQPDASVVVAVAAASRRNDRAPGAGERDLQPLLGAFAKKPEAVPGLLRGLWRKAAPGERAQLLNARLDPQGRNLLDTGDDPASARGRNLLEAIAALPGVDHEFELDLLGLAPEERARQQRLYELLVQGLIDKNQAGERRAQLEPRLMAGNISVHELQLLATLAVKTGIPLEAAQLHALAARLQGMPILSPTQRELLARVFAGAGDYRTAGRLLEACVVQLLHPDPPGSPGYDPWMGTPDAMRDLLVAVVDGLGGWQDAGAARDAYARLARLVDTEREGASVPLPAMPMPAWLANQQAP